MKKIQIAVDGPAGSGKSTVSKLIAKKLNVIYLDTGAMYRAVTLYILNHKIDVNDLSQVNSALESIDLSFDQDSILMNGNDISKDIRLPIVSQNVSTVAAIKNVRQAMTKLQQEIALGENVIMDGRDIGTHVLPNAQYKFFLDASVEERANRRYKELCDKSINVDYEDIKNKIIKRDELDRNRKEAPLRKADDAEIIDTTKLSISEVVDIIVNRVKDGQNV